MSLEHPEEAVARDLMARALGVPVRQHDDGSEPAMHDFEFVLADGRTGAAEMTTITDPLDRQWVANARFDAERRIDGSNWAWMVKRRGRPIGLRELMTHLRVLAPIAEQREQTDIDALALDPDVQHMESVQWLRAARLDIYAFRSTSDPGRVSFAGDNKAAFGEYVPLDPLLGWVEGELVGDAFDADFAKLSASGCDEQHLVLRVDIGNRIPDDLAMALIDRTSVLPTRSPAIAGRRLTGLWLIPEVGWSAIYWTADEGWQRIEVTSAAG